MAPIVDATSFTAVIDRAAMSGWANHWARCSKRRTARPLYQTIATLELPGRSTWDCGHRRFQYLRGKRRRHRRILNAWAGARAA
ncbi:hypothetical protein OK016_16870 [Vibrio chagasii]|nr:hypothetical protein [Vibrio chagasii]